MFLTELKLAKKVQQGMLPKLFPEGDGISLTAKYKPALEIGGDFYDIISTGKDKIAILIADATGHGAQATLSTALLKLAFSTYSEKDSCSSEILKGINSVLHRGLPDIELKKNDSLLLFTDSLSETRSVTEEMFDNKILLETIEKSLSDSGSEIIENLLSAAVEFRGSEQIEDDITMLCVDKN